MSKRMEEALSNMEAHDMTEEEKAERWMDEEIAKGNINVIYIEEEPAPTSRNMLTQHAIDRMDNRETFVPEHIRAGLIRYFEQHILPGNFLTAVLENNLMEAYKTADNTNIMAMKTIVSWLYNYGPKYGPEGNVYGSREAVKAWVARKTPPISTGELVEKSFPQEDTSQH